MKLTKPESKAHEEALKIAAQDRLSEDEKEFVLKFFHPGANHNIGVHGVFFTPLALAHDLAAVHGGGGRMIDACAGIGALAWSLLCQRGAEISELVCIELNPEFARIGRKILPEAQWITGDVFAELPRAGVFDSGVSNPPFGAMQVAHRDWPKAAHFGVIDLLTRHTRQGASVIIPANDCSPSNPSKSFARFSAKYPLAFLQPAAVDVRVAIAEGGQRWKGAAPTCAVCDLSFDGLENPYLV
jgi:hypothetical protein